MMPPVAGQPGRTAIITGGATVVFKELLDEVVAPRFLRTLSGAGFENVLIQCGSYMSEIHDKLANIQHDNLHIELKGFISNMKEQMRMCRGLAGVRPGGVVFSHAGKLVPMGSSPSDLLTLSHSLSIRRPSAYSPHSSLTNSILTMYP